MKTENDILNETINKKLNLFIFNLNDKPRKVKFLYHYNSVVNLSEALLRHNENDALKLKFKAIEFFSILDDYNYNLTSKLESAEFYRDYILPIGQYFIKKEHFRTKMDFLKNILFGVFIDCIIFIFCSYVFPLFSIIFSLRGWLKHSNAIKNKKYFGDNW